MAEVELSRRDAILTVTMNRPEKRNALNAALRRELIAALQRNDVDPDVRVTIVRGAGVCFSAGYDLSGTPDDSSGGTFVFTITAGNGVGSDASQTFTTQAATPAGSGQWRTLTHVQYGLSGHFTSLGSISPIAPTLTVLP